MKNKLKKLIACLLMLALAIPMCAFQGTTFTSNADTAKLEVLEIQPGTTFQLNSTDKYNITHMQMKQFIGVIDEINGKYDIIFVGNNSNDTYSARGAKAGTLPQGGTTDSTEYYSGNDITLLKAGKLTQFINSGQLTVFADSALTVNGSILESQFQGNSKIKTVSAGTSAANILGVFDANYIAAAKRPVLTFRKDANQRDLKPVEYDGTLNSYQTDMVMSFGFDMQSKNNSNLDAVLYVDRNGDGLFKNTEIVKSLVDKPSGTGYTINYEIPFNFNGLEPWKLEVTDRTTQAKSYLTGAVAFKYSKSKIRVLQLTPDNTTYDLNSLGSLLNTNEFSIEVTPMKMSAYNSAPFNLNGRYDMAVLGFADVYGSADISATSHTTNYTTIGTPDPSDSTIKLIGGAYTGNELKFNFVPPVRSGNNTYTAKVYVDKNKDGSFNNEKYFDNSVTGGQTYSVTCSNVAPTANYNARIVLTWGYNNQNSLAVNAPVSTVVETGNAMEYIKSFIETDQSVLFTHDTQSFYVSSSSGWSRNLTYYFRNLIGQDVFNTPVGTKPASYGFTKMALERANSLGFVTTDKVYQLNKSLVTQYPHDLSSFSQDQRTVATTHYQYFQLDLEDEDVIPIFTLTGNSRYNQLDARNDYYTYSKGSITYSGTGHSAPGSATFENRLFVNTMVKAIRGANLAPTVEINGILDNQTVDASSALSFSFVAADADGQERLDTTVRIDKNNDGDYNDADETALSMTGSEGALNGQETSVTLSGLGLTSGQQFGIKVEATDGRAVGYKTVSLINEVPQLTAKVTPEEGYLVGDTDTLNYVVARAGITGTVDVVTDITTVKNSNNEVGITSDHNGWTDATGGLSHGVTGTGGTYNLDVTFDKPGTYTVTNKFIQNSAEISGTTSNFGIIVKSGVLSVEVSDSSLRGISGLALSVKNIATNEVIKNKDGSDPKTGSTGFWTRSDLPSGDYKVTLTVPEGYDVTDDEDNQTAHLSYDYFKSNDTYPISFVMGGKLVDSATMSDMSGTKTDVTTVENGTTKSRLNFTLLSAVKELKFLVNRGTLGNQLQIKSATLMKDNGVPGVSADDATIGAATVSDGNLLTMPLSGGKLDSGQYYVSMSLFYQKPIAVGTYSIGVTEARLQDNAKTYAAGTYESQSLAATLNVRIVAKPKIE